MDTVKTLTEAYVEALEKLSGSAVIGVEVAVDRFCSRDADGMILDDTVAEIETLIRTR